MQKQIILLDGKPYKIMSFDDHEILFSSKSHKDFEALSQANIKSGLLESTLKVTYSNVHKLDYNESDDYFTLYYKNDKGKDKDFNIHLDSPATRGGVAGVLAESIGLKENKVSESKNTPLLTNIGILLFACVITWYLYGVAVDSESGILHEATGRKSGITNLVYYFTELVGKWGVLAMGGSAIAYMGYNAFHRYENPSIITSFER